MEPKKPIPLLEKLVRVRRVPRSFAPFFTVIANTLFRLDWLTLAPPHDFMREGFGPTPPSEPCESDSGRPVKGRPLPKPYCQPNTYLPDCWLVQWTPHCLKTERFSLHAGSRPRISKKIVPLKYEQLIAWN